MASSPHTSDEECSVSSSELNQAPAPLIQRQPWQPSLAYGTLILNGPSSRAAESIFPAGLYIDDAVFRIRTDAAHPIPSPYRPQQAIARDERTERANQAAYRA